MIFQWKGQRMGKSASSFLNFHRESIGISLISLWLEIVLCSLVLVKICCNKPRFCDCICHKWLSVGWVFAILVLWRLCFCFDSTGFTAMTSLSRKRIIIMPSTNDNKLGGVFHLHSTRCIIHKIQGCAEMLKSISIFCEIRLFKEFMSSRKNGKHRSEIQK